MKQEKRYLSIEEYTKWKLYSIIWLWLFLETLNILYLIFVYDVNLFKNFGWNFLLVILLIPIFLFLSIFLTWLFEKKFRKFWIDYHHERRYKYYESKIKKSVFLRLIFLVSSIIINVLLVCFGVCFRWTVKEIKNISKVCWISYYQSYWITKLPEEDKKLVLESCTENQEHQNLENIISRFLINNPNVCSFNSGNIDYAMIFYSDFEEKEIWRDKKTINKIKEIITDEINNCKRDIISKRIQLMDKDFDWNLWTEYNELMKFQKRINENLEKKLEELKN